MNEQGIAWIITGSTHEDSPEERRQRASRRELAAGRRARASLRDRVSAFKSLAVGRAPTPSPECCAA